MLLPILIYFPSRLFYISIKAGGLRSVRTSLLGGSSFVFIKLSVLRKMSVLWNQFRKFVRYNRICIISVNKHCRWISIFNIWAYSRCCRVHLKNFITLSFDSFPVYFIHSFIVCIHDCFFFFNFCNFPVQMLKHSRKKFLV